MIIDPVLRLRSANESKICEMLYLDAYFDRRSWKANTRVF